MLAWRIQLPATLVHRCDESFGVGLDLGGQCPFGDADRDLPGGRVGLLPRHLEHRVCTDVQQSPERDRAVELVDDRRAGSAVAADQDRVAAANQRVLDRGRRER
ncbi:MAG: hypothetical protein JRD94_15055 [Deltaproteobacteria bacterium]|nr:hypothetical protein [Deltaproteobacteria bacterium]